jgi:crotonobetainyl-CoA:carnitine CoA-transferase CaiB-like acyl-CoA transferase
MPYAGAYLADLGAEVIKVDTHHAQFMDTTRTINGPFPDNHPGELYWERGGTFHTLNRGKRSLTLDLRAGAAVEVVKALVQVSDVLLENFTPRVMARFGLSYSSLRALKPDLIMVSNTGYGHTGPWSDFGAMASALEPTHGTGAFMGYLDQDENGGQTSGQVPNKMGNSYTDFLATWTALAAVLACLFYRARTGRGAWVDLAMYQVGASFVGEGLLDFAFNGQRTGGRRARRLGNRHEHLAPHGCYPCRGNDAWVTLAVRDDGDWQALCRVIGQPGLASDPRFADPLARHRNQDELDPIIAEWTSAQGQYQVMEALQALGVPAGPVLNARQLLADPHFRARGFFETVDHSPESGLGRREYLGRGWQLSQSAVRIGGPAPSLGEGNDYVLRQVLGLRQEEIDKLRLEGVIGETPVGGRPPASIPLEQQVELGWTVQQDPEYQDFLSRLSQDGLPPTSKQSS